MNLRLTVRLRLTLLYGGLFLLAGAMLLTLNYALVRQSIDGRQEFGAVKVMSPVLPGQPLTPAMAGQMLISGPGIEAVPATDVLREYRESVRDSTLSNLMTRSIQTLAGMSIVALLFGWAIAGRVLGPLHRMTATAKRLSEQNLHERIALEGPDDELKELADTFDAMLGRLEKSFDSQRRFVANASHELRTPLSVIRTEVDVTLADPDAGPEDLRHMAEVVRDATRRCDALIDGLLVLARSDRGLGNQTRIDVAELADGALAQAAPEAAAGGVSLRSQLEPVSVQGDPALLGRLIENLVENGLRHNAEGPGGWVEVRTAPAPGPEGGAVVSVLNTGPVVPADEVAGLFEPFRRLGRDRVGSTRGVGLGLSIVRSVAAAHGGTVTAEPRPGGGLTVTVYLPAAWAGPA
jgi:signal transduction histidine kinase